MRRPNSGLSTDKRGDAKEGKGLSVLGGALLLLSCVFVWNFFGKFLLVVVVVCVCVCVCVFFSLLLVSHPETRQIENDRRSWKNKNDDNRPTKTTTAATGTRTTTAHRNKGGEREKPTTSNFLSKKKTEQYTMVQKTKGENKVKRETAK